jgi:hypothetical protein
MRYGSVCSGIEAKACSACGTIKPLEQFGQSAAGRLGRRAWCLMCARADSRRHYGEKRDVRLAATKARREADPARHRALRRDQKLKRLYGLSRTDFEVMVEAQGRGCAICKEARPLKVDHCHIGGHVRALLCGPCNTALGAFRDKPELLERAASYLRGHAR